MIYDAWKTRSDREDEDEPEADDFRCWECDVILPYSMLRQSPRLCDACRRKS